MSQEAQKNFDPILEDYAFFEDQSNEAEADAQAYVAVIKDRLAPGQALRMLDVGCGTGKFTRRLLTQLDWPKDQLQLHLMEPGEIALAQAREQLQDFCLAQVQANTELPEPHPEGFDFILANHVLYYVSPLEEKLRHLLHLLKPGGIFLCAMAGEVNPLITFWYEAFASIGEALPYHTAQDLEQAFARIEVEVSRQSVAYELRFPDSPENRLKILRFLLAENLERMDAQGLLSLMDPYREKDDICIRTESSHFLVC